MMKAAGWIVPREVLLGSCRSLGPGEKGPWPGGRVTGAKGTGFRAGLMICGLLPLRATSELEAGG